MDFLKNGEIKAFWLYYRCGCATKADVGKLANPAWSKLNQQTRTELCMQGGNKLCEAKGMANCRP